MLAINLFQRCMFQGFNVFCLEVIGVFETLKL
jgi:hypothetical protein